MTMFAIVRTGAKQYKISEGSLIDVEALEGEVGQSVTLRDVLLVSDDKKLTIGTPAVDKASVTAEIVEQKRDPKVIVFKYKAKKRSRTKTGHRQNKTRLKITKLSLS